MGKVKHESSSWSRFYLLVAIWGLGVAIGRAVELGPTPVYVYDGIKTELYVEDDASYAASVASWKIEVARRFPAALIVVCHGNQGKEIVRNAEDWYMYPEAPGCVPVRVRDKASELVKLYPNRPIVFLTCNPSGIRLHGLPNVYYALNSVWLTPDKNVEDTSHMRDKPLFVGNIFEFVSAE